MLTEFFCEIGISLTDDASRIYNLDETGLNLEPTKRKILYQKAVADLGGGWGGCIPPTSLKVTILAEKSALILNNSAPFRAASPPTDLNVTNPAEKSVSILVKTIFFFFFWRPPDFGRKKRLNFRFRPKNQSQFW